MVTITDYIKNITLKILDSVSIIESLDNNSDSLQILKIELKHINGFLSIIIRKLENRNTISDEHDLLLKKSMNYLENNDFFREIDQIMNTYSDDPNRIKNIKKLVMNSFQQKNFLKTLIEIKEN